MTNRRGFLVTALPGLFFGLPAMADEWSEEYRAALRKTVDRRRLLREREQARKKARKGKKEKKCGNCGGSHRYSESRCMDYDT
jgi:hypothetical protein